MSAHADGSFLLHSCIADALASPGYAILDDALPEDLARALLTRLLSLGDEDFTDAGIGREAAFRRNPAIRRDEISWLDPVDPATSGWFAWMEAVRLALNRRLFLGLFDYECHFARYTSGAFYRKHVDAFRGEGNRVVSTVLYLNEDWRPGDGGELLLYDATGGVLLERVEPLFNRLVLFLSADFPHEVLAARRSRYSLTGWFRLNASRGDFIDPPS